MEVLVPEYYPFFRCKIGRCRSACCEGWPVTFSMREYFRLLSLECSPELKRRLDAALHRTARPTEEEYGQLLPGFDGRCPMRLADGRCALQAEEGESALPDVCRIYPRGLRPGEACCANSCEAVIELLEREEPLRFVKMALEVPCPPSARVCTFETCGREMEIRLWLIALLQDRSAPLPERLARIGAALADMDEALRRKDAAAVERLLSGEERPSRPGPLPPAGKGLPAVRLLLERLDDLSDSVRQWGEAALARFDREGPIGAEAADRRLREISSIWEAWMENILVNHMFFAQFPFQDRPVSLRDETIALWAVYALLRFLAVGAGDGTRERFVDTAAALFRLVDHTTFDRYAVPILKGFLPEDRLAEMLTV